jgi:hypothetical protein
MEIEAVIITVVVAVKFRFAVDDAIMVTEVPTIVGSWSIEGAVKTATAPLPVC